MPFSEILEPGGMGAGSPALSSPRLPLSLPPCAQSGCERRLLLSLPLTGGGRPRAPGPPSVLGLLSSTPTLLRSGRSWSSQRADSRAAAAQSGALPPPICNPLPEPLQIHTSLQQQRACHTKNFKEDPTSARCPCQGAGKVPGAHRRASSKVVYFLPSLCSVSRSLRPPTPTTRKQALHPRP